MTTIIRVPSPPDNWAGITEDATDQQVAAADAEHEAWMQSPAGVLYLDWDRRLCEYANTRQCSYRRAMGALHVEFV